MSKNSTFNQLQRRGYTHGIAPAPQTESDPLSNWQEGKPVLLKAACLGQLSQHQEDITRSDDLYAAILDGQECDTLFTQSPYIERLENDFESLGCSVNEGDDQEIETIIYDALDPNDHDNIIAEDLWMKASWLSFYEDDASLRFRFSFGIDLVEDVAADKNRQHHASRLTNAIFPESSLITENSNLKKQLRTALQSDEFQFVERIVYFNAPNGGAYLHHDRERGHAGVVYTQLSGHTFWLALSKQALLDEISAFVSSCDETTWPETLSADFKTEIQRCINEHAVSAELETFSNSALIHLINETQEFIQHLIAQGHSRQLEPGDAILLPQDNELNCCWHSVFCLGEESGEALSFAIRSC